MEWAVLNRCLLSYDLKRGNESMFLSWGGNKFQRRGAERLNAMLPIVVRRVEWTDRCMEKKHLREREGVGTEMGGRGCGWPLMLTEGL